MSTLVFLPGLHGDAQTWDAVRRGLPPEVACRAVDLPAVSDLDRLTDDVAAEVPPGSVVVGHSLGGVVAMNLADRHPELLAGLVLVTAPPGAEDSAASEARSARAAGLGAAEYEEIALDGMESVYFGDRGRDPQVRAERLRAARVYGPRRFAAHSRALGSRPDRSGFLASVTCPVLVVGASHDRVVPTEEQRRWAETNGARQWGGGASPGEATGLTYAEIAETGHMVPVEAPAEFAQLLTDWLEAARVL